MGWSDDTIKFALLFALLFKPAPTGISKLLMKAAASSLHLPPTPIAKHDPPAALVVEKFLGRSFFASASSCKAAPANLPRPSSCRWWWWWWWWLVLTSLTPMLVATRAPASLQMRAVARSTGPPWLRSIPDWAYFAKTPHPLNLDNTKRMLAHAIRRPSPLTTIRHIDLTLVV